MILVMVEVDLVAWVFKKSELGWESSSSEKKAILSAHCQWLNWKKMLQLCSCHIISTTQLQTDKQIVAWEHQCCLTSQEGVSQTSSCINSVLCVLKFSYFASQVEYTAGKSVTWQTVVAESIPPISSNYNVWVHKEPWLLWRIQADLHTSLDAVHFLISQQVTIIHLHR